MPQAISAEQIQKAEQMLQARMQSDPAVSEKVRNGQIKWIVEPGDKISRLVAVDLSNPKSVSKYGGVKMYNTPQEAEHFTEGFGNQPTRSGGVANILESRTMPRYQHQRHDPIRKYTKDPALDVLQDATATARYLAPFLPVGPAAVAGVAAGLGTASKAVGALSGEEELQETWPNILTTAATAGLGSAGWNYFSEDATRKRGLKKHIERKLGYPSALEPELLPEIIQTVEGGNDYTLGDWRQAPLNRVYNELGTRTFPMELKDVAPVHSVYSKPDPKTGMYNVTPTKLLEPGTTPNFNQQQWTAIANKFIEDNGLPPSTNPKEVVSFLKEGIENRGSKVGKLLFPANGETPSWFTTNEWAALTKANENPGFTTLLKQKAHIKGNDEADNKRAEALKADAERYKERLAKHSSREKLVTPQQYKDFGNYRRRLPWIDFGGKSVGFNFRPAVRAGAALLPAIGAQVLLPYGIKWWNTRRDDE